MENSPVNVLNPLPSRRGRPSLQGKAMTPAEQKRQSRDRLKSQGSVEFSVRLSGNKLALVDEWAKTVAKTRTEIFQTMVDEALARTALIHMMIETMGGNGASLEEMQCALTMAMKPRSLDEIMQLCEQASKAGQ